MASERMMASAALFGLAGGFFFGGLAGWLLHGHSHGNDRADAQDKNRGAYAAQAQHRPDHRVNRFCRLTEHTLVMRCDSVRNGEALCHVVDYRPLGQERAEGRHEKQPGQHQGPAADELCKSPAEAGARNE